jgi:two-component system sensor histidine kinase AlgZ
MNTLKDFKGNSLANLLNKRALLAVIIVGQLLAILLASTPLNPFDPWLILPLVSLFIHFVCLSSFCCLHLIKRFLQKANDATQLLMLILLICSFTIIASYTVHSMLSLSILLPLDFMLRNLLMGFIVALLYVQFSVIYTDRMAIQHQATKARLSSLQARIRPHFLFNSLNVAAELTYQNPKDAEKTILAIAGLSRAAMYSDENHSLKQEIELAQQYLLIESWRFDKRLKIDWQLPDALPEIVIPSLTIQPLLENAICHGVENNSKVSTVRIAMSVTRTSITIIIENPYINAAVPRDKSNGMAVKNIKARLNIHFGQRAKLSHYIDTDIYRTKLVIPR